MWWLPLNLGHGESCESVFVDGSSVHQKCSNYALTNLLFGLCRFVSVIDLLVTLLSPHLRVLARPSAPKVLRTRERAATRYPFAIFTFKFAIESNKEFGVCHAYPQKRDYH